MDLKEFIDNYISGSKLEASEVIDFLEDRDWCGMKPDFSKGRVILDEEQIEEYKETLDKYLVSGHSAFDRLSQKVPATAKVLMEFADVKKVREEDLHYIADFLAYRLFKELDRYDNDDLETLATLAVRDLNMIRTEILTMFFDYCKSACSTRYTISIQPKPRSSQNTEAYSQEEMFRLVYYLFCEESIQENDMYRKAAISKDYTDTWLFLVIHFFCSVRFTDLERIYHPFLPKPPEVVLAEVASGIFSYEDAIATLKTVIKHCEVMPLIPSKTSKYSGVESVKIDIPTDCEALVGTLMACAEAHRQILGVNEPLIRKITTYKDISRYMGDEIGQLFLYRNFSSRSANKAHMQGIQMVGDQDPEENSISGAVLAAHARSHKGTYGKFVSDVTAIYLQDGKFSGMSVENAAYQYLQRGVLSGIVSMMFKLMPSLDYDRKSVPEQTAIHKILGYSPHRTEQTITALLDSREEAKQLVLSFVQNGSEEKLMDAIERIVSGKAVSKTDTIYCLKRAFRMPCQYPERQACLGCDFEILTKATLSYLISEYKRMQDLYHQSESKAEKAKWKGLATGVLMPKIKEMLYYFNEYPENVYKAYEEIIAKELHV